MNISAWEWEVQDIARTFFFMSFFLLNCKLQIPKAPRLGKELDN